MQRSISVSIIYIQCTHKDRIIIHIMLNPLLLCTFHHKRAYYIIFCCNGKPKQLLGKNKVFVFFFFFFLEFSFGTFHWKLPEASPRHPYIRGQALVVGSSLLALVGFRVGRVIMCIMILSSCVHCLCFINSHKLHILQGIIIHIMLHW